jgi:hypothetical protein
VDRFGCHHVDDAEASSGSEGDIVDDALRSILPKSRHDEVRTGRYVDDRGRLYRDPSGRGILGCNKSTAGFTPARPHGAVAVAVMPRRTGTFRRARATIVHVGLHGVRWMDLAGLPQRRPNEQTRGVILRDGTRLWLDVYPRAS